MKMILQKAAFLGFAVALSGTPLPAAPPAAAVLQTLWQENFTLPDSTRFDNGASGWTSTASYSRAVYGVIGNEFKINNTSSAKGPVVWTSALIDIAGKRNIQLAVTARSSADTGGWLEYDDSNIYDLQLADYIRMYYKVDDGPEVLFGDLRSNIKSNCGDTTVYSTGAISGHSIQIIIRARATAADEYYYFDNVTVLGSAGCTPDDIPSGVSVASSDRLTCQKTSVTLTGASTTAGAVYSWSGPNGYTAGEANVQVTAGGIYTLTVTNPANGCSKEVSLTVVQNSTPPANVTATSSGPITCDIPEVTLIGHSTTANMAYQWDGPNNYQSFLDQDVVVDAGDYILTVTNPDNGCKTKVTTTIVNTCTGLLEKSNVK